MAEDFADQHVARWRDHWVDVTFDDAIEAATVRVQRITHYLGSCMQASAAGAGLQDFEYRTLHALMIRETPGRASPMELARDLEVSPAGITGRLDTLEESGYIKRTPSLSDRRRVDIEATKAGTAIWRQVMDLRGRAEEELFNELDKDELATLNQLLKKLTTKIESDAADSPE